MTKLYLIFFALPFLLFKSDKLEMFELKCKQQITIKVKVENADSVNFEIVETKNFDKVVDAWGDGGSFPKKGRSETLDFFLCEGRSNGKKCTVLTVLNWSKKSFVFNTEVRIAGQNELKSVPNTGSHTNSKMTEVWEWQVSKIKFSNFKLKQ